MRTATDNAPLAISTFFSGVVAGAVSVCSLQSVCWDCLSGGEG